MLYGIGAAGVAPRGAQLLLLGLEVRKALGYVVGVAVIALRAYPRIVLHKNGVLLLSRCAELADDVKLVDDVERLPLGRAPPDAAMLLDGEEQHH